MNSRSMLTLAQTAASHRIRKLIAPMQCPRKMGKQLSSALDTSSVLHPMKYSLRSLMIVTGVTPLFVGGLYYFPLDTLVWLVIPLATCLFVHLMAKSYPGAVR